MKKIFLVAVLSMLTTASAGYCQAQPVQQTDKSSPLTLTIKTDKEVYEVGENVNVSLTLANSSERSVSIDQESSRFSFEVKSANGNSLEKITYADVESTMEGKDAFLKIAAGQYLEFFETLYISPSKEWVSLMGPERTYKGIALEDRMNAIFPLPNIPGRYELRTVLNTSEYLAKQRASEYGIQDTFIGTLTSDEVGTLTSNTIAIEIMPKNESADYPPSISLSQAKSIAEDFLSKQSYKDAYVARSSPIEEFDDYVDCYFKRRTPLDVKGDGLIRVDKKTWKPEWIPSQ